MSQLKLHAATTSDIAEKQAVPAIEMLDVCKNFKKFQAVDHLNLTVQQGEVFGLLGPNGSGKTTTINMISGLSEPSSGSIRVMGYDLRQNKRKVRQLLGAVPRRQPCTRN